jgi:NADPH-dependent glutamate synthase beta subunit-like oxidoreductase
VDPEELERALAVPGPALDKTGETNVRVLREYAARGPGAGEAGAGPGEAGPRAGEGTGAGEAGPGPGEAGPRAGEGTGAGEAGPGGTGEPEAADAAGGEVPARRRILLRFLLSPVEILPDERGRVGAVRFARNELVPGAEGRLGARPTGVQETIPAGLVLRAIGYRGIPLPGVPFDERRGVIPCEGGRVTGPEGRLPGEYVVGWIKRGPSGVIGTNKRDAQETVNAIFEDLAAGQLPEPPAPDPEELLATLRARQPELVTYAGWSEIDRHERAQGEPTGRPRVKLTRIEEMLRVAAREQP